MSSLATDAKKKTVFAVEQQREDVAEARRQWSATQLSIEPDRVVFIDETWAKTNMARTYGRSPRGTRLIAHVPYGRWETTTFLGAEVRYLPPYSPDLNPIELAFSKLKKLLRDGAQRTTERLWQLCGEVLDLFTEHECRNYLKHCGYRYS